MEKITRDTKVLDLVEQAIENGNLHILSAVVKLLKRGQNPHIQGVDYTYPARDIVEGIVHIEGCTTEEIWEELSPSWLKRFEDLVLEISKERNIKL